MGAAAIRIQRPFERHPFDAIERGSAADFLVSGGVRAPDRFGQRFGAADFNEVGDLPRRGFGFAEIEEKRCGFHKGSLAIMPLTNSPLW